MERAGRVGDGARLTRASRCGPATPVQVNKAGPNKGRFFYTCPRPEGKPPDGRCQFFKWVEKRAGDHPNTLLGQPSGSAAKRHKSDK